MDSRCCAGAGPRNRRDEAAEAQPSFDWFDVEAAPRVWDCLAREAGLGGFHQSRVLGLHRFGRARRVGVVTGEGAGMRAVVGGLVRDTGRGRQFESLSFPTLGSRLGTALPEHLSRWLATGGIGRVRFGSFDGGVETYALPEQVGRVQERVEFLLDLGDSPEQRFRSLRTNHRRKLRRTEKLGLRLERVERYQSLVMTRLHHSWACRRGSAGLRDLVDGWRWHRRLQQWLTRHGDGALYVLRDRAGVMLSMAYMLETPQSAFYMIGASSAAGYREGASVRLFWELAARYQEQGLVTLNLGGVPAQAAQEGHDEHGVYRFKRGFGIDPVSRQTLTMEGI